MQAVQIGRCLRPGMTWHNITVPANFVGASQITDL